MTQKTKKKAKPSLLSSAPYKRRLESDIIKIVREIQSGVIKKNEACRKNGLHRNMLVNWVQRLSVRTIQEDTPNELLCSMTEKQQDRAFLKKVKELTRVLKQAKIKTESLETIIKATEEALHIKIRKRRGTKQQD